MTPFPDVSEAFSGWTSDMTFKVVTKNIVDLETTDVDQTTEEFDGSLEPMKPTQLVVKPEGERKWKWWMLFSRKELKLDSQIIGPDGSLYRVMSVSNWSNGSHYEYELRQGPFG